MSIQNNTAVDVYQDFILPTALDSDFSSEDLADDMDGLQLTMQRVKIPGGGNLQRVRRQCAAALPVLRRQAGLR